MARDKDTPPIDVEFLDDDGFDEVLPVSPPWRLRGFPLLVAVVILAVVVTLIVRVNTNEPSASPPSPTPTSRPPTTTEPVTSPTAAPPSLPASTRFVTTVAAPLLGVTAGWELFGRGDQAVVRIQFARGRITSTGVPALRSNGAVSFVVGSREAVVRPLNFVPGYRVPDGQPARQLAVAPTNGQSEPVFPGPDPDHVWATPVGGGPADIGLARLSSAGSGPLLPVPAGAAVQDAAPDGAGYLLFHGPGGIYNSRPSGLRLITTGQVLAVGPTRWLVRECGDRSGTCRTVVIDQASRTRRVLATRLGKADVIAGVISPDGSTAALAPGSGPPLIQIVDLSTGAVRPIPLLIDRSAFDPGGSLAWSPDSRWLFATNADGALYAVDARSDQIVDLTAATKTALPPLTQIAIRA